MSTCVGIQEDEQRTEEGTDRTAQNQIWYRCRINEVTHHHYYYYIMMFINNMFCCKLFRLYLDTGNVPTCVGYCNGKIGF